MDNKDFAAQKLHVLYISQYFHPEPFLGNAVAKALVERGHEVNAIVCVPNYPTGSFLPGYGNGLNRDETWEGVKVRRAWTVAPGRSRVRLLLNYLTYPITASWEISRLGRPRGDVSFAFMPSPIFQALAGTFAKWVYGIPSVLWVQDIWPDSAVVTLGIRNRLVKGILNAICGWIYRRADLVMVQSDAFIDRIVQLGVAREKLVTVPNMAPPGFTALEDHEVIPEVRSLLPNNRFIIMFAGNIGASQDFDTIIRAAHQLRGNSSILWVIVGSGREDGRVREMVKEHGLEDSVLLLGRYPPETMPSFFACADVMLISLVADPLFDLTVPSKLQSYMACGKPIAASLGGEGARIIEAAGAGLAVPPSQPLQLAEMVQKFALMPPEVRRSMGARGRRFFEDHYTAGQVIGTIEALLQSRAKRD